eukprot:m.245210 g.245210  ORF g.245210 m.245210 type:complete len:54 (+) comp15849_c0_seq15:2767-2928(+)
MGAGGCGACGVLATGKLAKLMTSQMGEAGVITVDFFSVKINALGIFLLVPALP